MQLADRDTAAKETDLRQQSTSEELEALRRTASTGTNVLALLVQTYLLYWYKSTNTDADGW